MGRPHNWVPVQLPESHAIYRGDHVAVDLWGMQVIPAGLAFHITVRSRVQEEKANPRDQLIKTWKLGAVLSTGAKVIARAEPQRLQQPDGYALTREHGIGYVGRPTEDNKPMWLWPLPPPPSMELVFAWPAQNIPETWITIDTTEMERMAQEAVELWPPQDEIPDRGNYFLPA